MKNKPPFFFNAPKGVNARLAKINDHIDELEKKLVEMENGNSSEFIKNAHIKCWKGMIQRAKEEKARIAMEIGRK